MIQIISICISLITIVVDLFVFADIAVNDKITKIQEEHLRRILEEK